ncbi:hypothetical protein GE115_05950 [Agromyces sp. CFH 90414]|uniref:Uncharacterized protein n=1 Tax=Agromyces agglutinans TaxID=2662258 RepID=A0A6I2F6N5_9MICO|nr:hypothetical protein [Agromyces agglutinans]MRG59417.1 hypothetical protein [Agromyces agglutinans]
MPAQTTASATPALHCDFDAADFRATAFRSGGSRLIRVSGEGLCPSAGWELEFAMANPGVVPHPSSLWLQLRERTPRDATARVRTVTLVEAIIEDTEATEIVIRFGWRNPIRLDVIEASPAGAAMDATASARRDRVGAR